MILPIVAEPPRIVALRSSPSLVDIAYEAIVEAIVQRRFGAGQRITIDQIARDLNMSITPVREALMRVAGNGLLLQSRNRGFTVAPLLTHTTYHQLFATRELLETYAVSNAQPTDPELGTLRELQAQMAGLKPSTDYAMYRRFNQLDHAFHRQVVMLARNPYLTDAWSNLHFHLQMSRLYVGEGVIDHEDAAREHAQIVDALQERRLGQAAEALRAHIEGAEHRLIYLLPEGPSEASAEEPPDKPVAEGTSL